MADVDVMDSPELQRVTVAAVVLAAGRGLLTATEAGLLIDRILTHPTSPLDPDRSVR